MNRFIATLLFLGLISASAPSFANRIYRLILSATRASPRTETWDIRWNRVDDYLTHDPRADIDFAAPNLASGRVLLRFFNPSLYRRHYVALSAYDFLGALGSGHFGTVRLARYKPTGELVALKYLMKNQFLDEGIQYPPREPRILERLDHPNIMKLRNYIREPEGVALVMQHIQGEELFGYVANRKYLAEAEAREFMWQLVDAVEYMHSKGVVHRDLKLENILVDKFGHITIIDFGLGNFFCQTERLKTHCGSAKYAAPEIMLGRLYDGRSVDVWTLGVILFIMRAGYPPFETYGEIVTLNIDWPEHQTLFSRDLVDLLRHILRNPHERYTLEQIKQHPWMRRRE